MIVALGWNRQNALALECERGFIDCDELKKAVYCAQSRVARAYRVATLLLEVMKKPFDQLSIEGFQWQARRRALRCLGGKPPMSA